MATVEEQVNAATSENLTSEDWGLILDICDTVEKLDSAREYVVAISKRIPHKNANVSLYALTLIESLVKNCGMKVHLEVSSRPFVNVLINKLNDKNTHQTVRDKILSLVQEWTRLFGKNPDLGFMEDTYNKLKSEGFSFPSSAAEPKKDRNDAEVAKRKEQEDLELAIALSLSAAEAKKSTAKSTPAPAAAPPKPKEQKTIFQVRALYDFPGIDRGELGFMKGDIINVIENDYQDWWTGELRGKTGLIPSNYVDRTSANVPTTPVSASAADADLEAAVLKEAQNVDKLLMMLSNIDPSRDSLSENDTLQNLYSTVITTRPKLVKLLDANTQKKDRLMAINDRFMKAKTTYHRLWDQSMAHLHATQQQRQQQVPVYPYQQSHPQPAQQPYHHTHMAQSQHPAHYPQTAVVQPQPQYPYDPNVYAYQQPAQSQGPQQQQYQSQQPQSPPLSTAVAAIPTYIAASSGQGQSQAPSDTQSQYSGYSYATPAPQGQQTQPQAQAHPQSQGQYPQGIPNAGTSQQHQQVMPHGYSGVPHAGY
ncbi:hypothetical protein BKA69DRAFT_1071517 [Paraphysoderma sedebokerense]|nr:hypothetical protein BKA69DRAFT_1071517 [Paraphysoderma sedebokerense]